MCANKSSNLKVAIYGAVLFLFSPVVLSGPNMEAFGQHQGTITAASKQLSDHLVSQLTFMVLLLLAKSSKLSLKHT